MQSAGSDDSDDDSEEELTATRSKLKEESEMLSPEQQQEVEHRRQHTQLLARQDRRGEVRFSYKVLREEQERRWQQDSDRKRAEEAQQKQLHDLPAVAKPREMDRECASLQHRPESCAKVVSTLAETPERLAAISCENLSAISGANPGAPPPLMTPDRKRAEDSW